MTTYFSDYTKKGNLVFRNDSNQKKNKIKSSDVLRFGTCWTAKKEDYRDTEGFFEDCNCFIQESYSVIFCQLSEDGEELICNL